MEEKGSREKCVGAKGVGPAQDPVFREQEPWALLFIPCSLTQRLDSSHLSPHPSEPSTESQEMSGDWVLLPLRLPSTWETLDMSLNAPPLRIHSPVNWGFRSEGCLTEP